MNEDIKSFTIYNFIKISFMITTSFYRKFLQKLEIDLLIKNLLTLK